MKVLVLGAAGECGRHLTAELARAPEIECLTVADADARATRGLLDRLGLAAVEFVELEIADHRALALAAADADCMVNCAPFTFFDAVIEAAIEAGVHYVDLISHPSEQQRRRAKDAGIVALSGLGVTPGTSNVLCAHAAADFDHVRECHINFASFRTIAPSRGLLETVLFELWDGCPNRRVYEDGRWKHKPSLEGSHLVHFPEPVGPQRVYIMPHPETDTLPSSFPDLRAVSVRGTWPPDLMADIAVLNKYGLLDDVPASGGEATVYEVTKQRVWETWGGIRERVPEWSSFQVIEVAGERDGARLERTYTVTHDGWGTEAAGKMPGLHAALGVRLLARHRTGPGVGFVAPELYFDPHEYVDELRRMPETHLDWAEQAGDAVAGLTVRSSSASV
jgi:saccharopine dehydrogenase-like NADP-dependent oxidoreductase